MEIMTGIGGDSNALIASGSSEEVAMRPPLCRQYHLRFRPMSSNAQTPDLAVAMCTCNNQRTVGRALESVKGLARRIVVVDSGSTDGTIDTCRSLGAEVIERPWAGYSAQKQYALDRCRDHRWVLLLDSDESLEPQLQDNIRRVIDQDNLMFSGWEINRKMWFMGDWLNRTYQPDWVLRLVRGGAARMSNDAVHERVIVEGTTGKLAGIMTSLISRSANSNTPDSPQKINRAAERCSTSCFTRPRPCSSSSS
jgi:hypothetical protein